MNTRTTPRSNFNNQRDILGVRSRMRLMPGWVSPGWVRLAVTRVAVAVNRCGRDTGFPTDGMIRRRWYRVSPRHNPPHGHPAGSPARLRLPHPHPADEGGGGARSADLGDVVCRCSVEDVFDARVGEVLMGPTRLRDEWSTSQHAVTKGVSSHSDRVGPITTVGRSHSDPAARRPRI